jgi:hypothetical protein
MAKESNLKAGAMMLLAIAILVHAGVYFFASNKQERYLYSHAGAWTFRTDRVTGEVLRSSENGWEKWQTR